MTTAALEKPSSPAPQTSIPAPQNRTSPPRPACLLIGLDLGTNKSCVLAGPLGSTDITVSKVVPSVVGYVKDGIVDGIITGNAGSSSARKRFARCCTSSWPRRWPRA
jgi:rod shape-determining protein MreB and related proteins